jgi:hypothetical protein
VKIISNGFEAALERILLPIVKQYFCKNKEAKASEVPVPKAFGVGTENERKGILISICS